MGAETAAPIARAPSHRRAARGGADAAAGGATGPQPLAGNRAQLALLSRLGPVMRCGCGCGGACEEPAVMRCACGCGGKCEEDLSVARKAAPGPAAPGGSALGSAAAVVSRPGRALDGRTRSRMEHGFGRDLGGVRIHTDAAAATSARRLGARAYTVGDHIVFGAGQYAPEHRTGQHLIAHELTHTMQQRDRRHVQRAGTVSRPNDPHEREAEATASAVMAGRAVAPSRQAPGDVIHRDLLDDALGAAGSALAEAGELVEDVVDTGADLVGDAIQAGEEIAGDAVAGVQAAWDLAHSLATALGGGISVSGCGISIAIPRIPVDASVTVPVSLPSFSRSVPVAFGLIPIAGIVNGYGIVYLNLSVLPSLEVQLGPAALNSGLIVIDWCAPTYGGAISVTYTLAAALGAEVRGGIGGQVGLEVNVPAPPIVIPIPIPLASIDVGITGAVLGTGVTTITDTAALFYTPGGLSYGSKTHADVGMKLSAGIGLFGALTALGTEFCTLYWPLFTRAWENTWSLDRSVELAITPSGVTAGFGVSQIQPGSLAFDDFPLHVTSDVLSDNCPQLDAVCKVLYALGWMPSQRGGVWDPGAIAPWPGPLPDVYPRDPGIPSKSLCRGACGINCWTCDHVGQRNECVPDGDHHHWVVYPDFEECPTHDGCRQHDGCFDWCTSESPIESFLCRRLCDIECACVHRPGTCFGWIFGIGADGRMQFSGPPVSKPGCRGPCPETKKDAKGASQLRLCLPPVFLTDPQSVDAWWGDSTDDVVVWTGMVPVPYIGGVPVTVTARGDIDASAMASLDAIRLDNVCLIVDPVTLAYSGQAEIHVPASFDASLALAGTMGAILGVPCLELAAAKGTLVATAFFGGSLDFTDRLAVVCEFGEINLVNTASLQAQLDAGFKLDAIVRLLLLGFELWSKSWEVGRIEWNKDWDWELAVFKRQLPFDPIVPQLNLEEIDPAGLATFLFSNAPDVPAVPQAAGAGASGLGGLFELIAELCPKSGPPPAEPDCGKTMPDTVVTYIPESSDRGEHVIAEPLTRCPGKNRGSRPSRSIFRKVRDQCIPKGDEHYWVAAHLLHGDTGRSPDNLHGSGKDPRNLILTNASLNGQMRAQVEKPAIDAVKANKILFYDVTVKHAGDAGHRRFFGESVVMDWGYLKADGKRGPSTPKTIVPVVDRPVPDCPNYTP
jgi:hypothetical protein